VRGSDHAPAPEFQGTRCVSRRCGWWLVRIGRTLGTASSALLASGEMGGKVRKRSVWMLVGERRKGDADG
jgi:hypothetical protein